jgi:hypothetical protein
MKMGQITMANKTHGKQAEYSNCDDRNKKTVSVIT